MRRFCGNDQIDAKIRRGGGGDRRGGLHAPTDALLNVESLVTERSGRRELHVSGEWSATITNVKIDPFAPQMLLDYEAFCRKNGPCPFSEYAIRWHAATALMEAAAAEGRDPLSVTLDDLHRVLPAETVL
jgi:hypothetical protein